jgi:cystathionine beta-lyase
MGASNPAGYAKDDGHEQRTRKLPGAAQHPNTRVVTGGRDPASYHGFVNPPVYHASTVLYPSAEDFVAHRARYQYGRRGTPTTEALELALRSSKGRNAPACRCCRRGSRRFDGACCRCATGDHLLVTDSAYGPTRKFATRCSPGSASPRPITIR